jgi:hypothetical protein
VFENLEKNALNAATEAKTTKSDMHDCKIPKTLESRDIDIKKYVDKLEELERIIETCQRREEVVEASK